MGKFTTNDVDQLRAFSTFLAKHADLNRMKIEDTIQFVKLMQSYQLITNKVEAHIVELVSYTEPAPVEPKPKVTARKKSS